MQHHKLQMSQGTFTPNMNLLPPFVLKLQTQTAHTGWHIKKHACFTYISVLVFAQPGAMTNWLFMLWWKCSETKTVVWPPGTDRPVVMVHFNKMAHHLWKTVDFLQLMYPPSFTEPENWPPKLSECFNACSLTADLRRWASEGRSGNMLGTNQLGVYWSSNQKVSKTISFNHCSE